MCVLSLFYRLSRSVLIRFGQSWESSPDRLQRTNTLWLKVIHTLTRLKSEGGVRVRQATQKQMYSVQRALHTFKYSNEKKTNSKRVNERKYKNENKDKNKIKRINMTLEKHQRVLSWSQRRHLHPHLFHKCVSGVSAVCLSLSQVSLTALCWSRGRLLP